MKRHERKPESAYVRTMLEYDHDSSEGDVMTGSYRPTVNITDDGGLAFSFSTFHDMGVAILFTI